MRKFIQRAADILDRSPDFFEKDTRLYELNRRFLWFIVFRFIVILVFLILVFAKSSLFPKVAVSSSDLLLMAFFLLFCNFCYWFHYRRLVRFADFSVYSRKMSYNVQVQILVDFVVLGYLAYRCGGVESPLVYFFLFHNVISCLFFGRGTSFVYTLLSISIVFFVTLAPVYGLLPIEHFIVAKGGGVSYRKLACYYDLGGIAVVYLVVWFFISNITDSLKRHEARLQEKIEELIEMDTEKTRYMLVTTHELKAPFSSIQSYVSVMLDGYAGDINEKVRDILWKIKLRCTTLMRMITEMIQLANITSLKDKKEELVMKKMNVVQMIGTVARRLKESAMTKGVNIVWPEDEFYEIEANSEQIDILFNNILSNAISYCYPDTVVVVKITEDAGHVLVNVTDKGIVIKPEHIEKVFAEYFRSEEAVTMNRNSTGLGLPISKQIMELHGGRIWIESGEETGTSVFMEFNRGEQQ